MFCRPGKHCRATNAVTRRKPWHFRQKLRFEDGTPLANSTTTTKDSRGLRLCH
jgi:hypothetical protein